jgi:hypothetical protein
MKKIGGKDWTECVAQGDVKVTQNSRHYCSLEKHWHPAGLEFIRIYRALELPPLAFQLYLYMLFWSSPVDSPRVKNAHLHGDTIQKGEFFENKVSVADFFGKGELEEKAKTNWFMRTVKPLVQMGLVEQIELGRRGCNASYIVHDVREILLC